MDPRTFEDAIAYWNERIANGELLQFTADERAELVAHKKRCGLSPDMAEAAVKRQEEADRERGLDLQQAQEGKPEPEPVPASAGKGKGKK